MKFYLSMTATAVICAALLLTAVGTADADPHGLYLKPDLKVGEQPTHVFSKAVSIKGKGFKEYVGRTSGTRHDTVVSINPSAIAFKVVYRYDGRPGGAGEARRLADGITDCWNAQCAVNRSTSGTVWSANIAHSWEPGPCGIEAVRVVEAIGRTPLRASAGDADANAFVLLYLRPSPIWRIA